jgi:hypothetical protein
VTPDERLAGIYETLTGAGMQVLVMGGHAVRFYGIDRNTVDFDLHLVGTDWERLPGTLQALESVHGGSFQEEATWRPRDFRRFVIGRLPGGREERLECWRRNHLLAPFIELYARRTEGLYGGKKVAFLDLKDLIGSKETEREDDWRDLELLEEIVDERALAKAADPQDRLAFLCEVRSRRGFEAGERARLFEDSGLISAAWLRAQNPISRAFLAPFVSEEEVRGRAAVPCMMEEIIAGPLRKVRPASSRHLALVEAVRRLYKRAAMEADRRDKLRQAEEGA